MKTIITALVFLTSSYAWSQANYELGVDYSLKSGKSNDTALSPRLGLGYNLQLSEVFALNSTIVATSLSSTIRSSYVLQIDKRVKAHLGLNFNLANNLAPGMQVGYLFNDRYLVEFVKSSSHYDKPDYTVGGVAIGLKFNF